MKILKKQSDLGLHRLSRPFCQATSVHNFRIFTIQGVQNYILYQGVQWLSGKVLDLRLRGRRFEPHLRQCIVVLEQDTFILA